MRSENFSKLNEFCRSFQNFEYFQISELFKQDLVKAMMEDTTETATEGMEEGEEEFSFSPLSQDSNTTISQLYRSAEEILALPTEEENQVPWIQLLKLCGRKGTLMKRVRV